MNKVAVLKAAYTNTLREYYVREFNIKHEDGGDQVLKKLQKEKDLAKEILEKEIEVLKSAIEKSSFNIERVKQSSQFLVDIDACLTKPEDSQILLNITTKSLYSSPNNSDNELEGLDGRRGGSKKDSSDLEGDWCDEHVDLADFFDSESDAVPASIVTISEAAGKVQ